MICIAAPETYTSASLLTIWRSWRRIASHCGEETTTGPGCGDYMEQGLGDVALGPKVKVQLLLDKLTEIQVQPTITLEYSVIVVDRLTI